MLRQTRKRIPSRASLERDASAGFHGLGGCPLGRATDAYGRIPDHPGRYVMDGSSIPVRIGANPSLTITALSERNIERILAEDFEV